MLPALRLFTRHLSQRGPLVVSRIWSPGCEKRVDSDLGNVQSLYKMSGYLTTDRINCKRNFHYLSFWREERVRVFRSFEARHARGNVERKTSATPKDTFAHSKPAFTLMIYMAVIRSNINCTESNSMLPPRRFNNSSSQQCSTSDTSSEAIQEAPASDKQTGWECLELINCGTAPDHFKDKHGIINLAREVELCFGICLLSNGIRLR
ncbi:hypothetical protein F5141DRAFT_1063559 [Pisolithus sp. B1]|nr:hypothetical protein F5141DRAFT_1063559 [Pisolithus sp. B1]